MPTEKVAVLMQLVNMCETFHCLPSSGGVLDQDPWLMDQFVMVQIARQERYNLDHPPTTKMKG